MFQVIVKMDQGTSIGRIEALLPSGWTVEEAGSNSKVLNLMNGLEGVEVGHVRILNDKTPGKILITADEESPQGKHFWRDFGMKYNELDPFDLRFGVIYLSDVDKQVFELDELPKELPMEKPDLEHYSMVKGAFYVSFLLGDWHSGESLQVQTISRILEDGSTEDAPDMPKLFALGNLENEATM